MENIALSRLLDNYASSSASLTDEEPMQRVSYKEKGCVNNDTMTPIHRMAKGKSEIVELLKKLGAQKGKI